MPKKNVRLITLFILGTLMLTMPQANAADPQPNPNEPLQKLIGALHKNGSLDKKTHDDLIKVIDDNRALSAPVAPPAAATPKIETSGRFQITSADGNSSFRVGGRLHLDGTFFDNDTKTNETNGFDARRARLEFQGTMYKNWDWKLDYEFGQTTEVKGGFRDAFVRFRVPDSTSSVTIGQFKEYFGLEHMNSSNDLPFVERALPSRVFHDIAEASDGRRLGIGYNVNDKELTTFSLGAFARNISGDSTDEAGDPFALESRLTLSPVHSEREAVHVGLNANWIDLNDPSRGKLSSRPEARIGAETLIQTGQISNAESFSRYAAELAFVEGPAWLQAEYLFGTFDRNIDPTVTFAGWHADVGYVLTGESRVYDFERGTVKNPKVAHATDQNGCGAWELAARMSGLDYNDKDIQGGRETNFSTGVNWYPNNNFRFMLTWTKVLEVAGGEFDNQNPSEILFRSQFAF